MFLLVIIVALALGSSFVCSVLEAALLSASIGDLTARAQNGNAGAALLLGFKRDRPDDAISAILIVNTIAHTIGSTLAGAQAAKVFGDEWVGLFSGVLTLLVLVATEIIPKTIGTVYAAPLSGGVGRVLKVMTWAMSPVLWVTGLLTRLVSGGHHKPISRAELAALVQIAHSEGTLQADQSKAVRNLLEFDGIPVSDVMTPRSVIQMLPVTTTVDEFLHNKDAGIYSRLPVFRDTRDHVVGYVLQRAVLRAAAHGRRDIALEEVLRPIEFIPNTTSVGVALRKMLGEREHIAIVVDDFGGVSGLLTLEDLVETALGEEITDEWDDVADLRELAKALRDQRLERMATFREEASQTGAPAPEAGEGD